MLSIINHKIIMQQGDTTSFRVVVKNSVNKFVQLSELDKITIRLKRRDRDGLVLSKMANPTYVETENGRELYHIIGFDYRDTVNIPFGDYLYDVILEVDNQRFTIVPASSFVLQESISLMDIEDNTEGTVIIIGEDRITDFTSIMSPIPLIGKLEYINYVKASDEGDEDDLILF